MKKYALFILFCISPFLHAETLLVAGFAGYKRPVSELSQQFEKVTNNKVDLFYGNMAQVLAQTSQSDDVSLVIGDLSFLKQAKKVSFSHFIPLGDGTLVLAYAKGKSLDSPQQLLSEKFTRIALPDTKKAVYGIAAHEFLSVGELDKKLKNKLMEVSSVPQVSSYLISGEVDAGFINMTEALAIQDKIGGYIEIDHQTYSPIYIAAAVVKGHENNAAVKAFQNYLNSDAAHKALQGAGL